MNSYKNIYLLFFFFLIIFPFNNIYAKEKTDNFQTIKKEKGIYINGDYVTYINVGSKYEELNATFYDDSGNDISDEIIVSYYRNKVQVFDIDTRFMDEYLVKYEIEYEGRLYKAYKVVIISDTKGPIFDKIETKKISSLEAVTYDVNEGVKAHDYSGGVSINCENAISTNTGNYVVKCEAKDKYNNKSVKNRLIKVIEPIKFTFDKDLTIYFPSGDNYTYKYSLDGGLTFNLCSKEEIIKINKGSVIGAVFEGDDLIMSNTYLVN